MSHRTRKNPLTGKDVIPADLLADAQSGKGFDQLTDAEHKEFAALSQKLQDKVRGIAITAILGTMACDPHDDSLTPKQFNDTLGDMFTDDQTKAA